MEKEREVPGYSTEESSQFPIAAGLPRQVIMDDKKSKELVARREQLKLQQAYDDVISKCQGLFSLFENDNIEYEVVHPIEPVPDLLEPSNFVDWLDNNFPFQSQGGFGSKLL